MEFLIKQVIPFCQLKFRKVNEMTCPLMRLADEPASGTILFTLFHLRSLPDLRRKKKGGRPDCQLKLLSEKHVIIRGISPVLSLY